MHAAHPNRTSASKKRAVRPSEPAPAARERKGWLAQVKGIRIGRSRWTVPAVVLLLVAFLLAVVGLTFVASASSISSLHSTGDSWTTFDRQVLWAALAGVVLIVTAFLPYRVWWTFALVLYPFAALCTILTLTGLGMSRNGSSRWIGSEALGFQPSELLKIATIAMLAGLFSKQSSPAVMASKHFVLWRILPIVGVAILPVLLQPDMGTAVIIAVSAAAVVVTAGMPTRRLLQGGLLGGAGAFLYAYGSSYRRDRLTAFLRPDQDVTGVGWHVAQSKLGFASGRLLGVGIGASRAKWGFVPNAHTDFVFAIIGEELGLVGATVVLLLFGLIAVVGLSVVNHAQDRFGSLLAVGITTWIVSQAFINMGAVLGLLPVTGVPMPFVSYGGSSFIVVAAGFGVLVNVARTAAPRTASVRTSRRRPRHQTVAGSAAI
jgi:cell division protein FtsW